jgi:hypothetical protein
MIRPRGQTRVAVRAAGMAWLLACALPAQAAESRLCTPITSVPITITQQGRYCATAPLRHDAAGGTAIWIQSDFVTVDLNGFVLDGSAGGQATTAVGIYAHLRRNVVIRNGTIRGFMFGVRLEDDAATGHTTGGAHIVEDVRVDRCTLRAIAVQGRGNVVRQAIVTNSGASTFFSTVWAAGIETRGPGARLLDNTVVETRGSGSGSAWAITVRGPNAVVEGNRVSNNAVAASSDGIQIQADSRAMVVRNRAVNFARGAAFEQGASGVVRGNVTSGCTLPYQLGAATDAGGNQ